MRAVEMSRFGGPEVFEVVEKPIPELGRGEVLVRGRAAGVNFADTLMRQNRYALTPQLPSVLGHEVAGVIEGLGDGVSGLAVGARVAAPLFAAGVYFGGYADYVRIDAGLVVPIPDALSFEDATALIAQGLTALFLTRQAPPIGKTVLISAAAGGVGTLLVQLATTRGGKDRDRRRKHGGEARLRPFAGCGCRRRLHPVQLDRTGTRGERRIRARHRLRIRWWPSNHGES